MEGKLAFLTFKAREEGGIPEVDPKVRGGRNKGICHKLYTVRCIPREIRVVNSYWNDERVRKFRRARGDARHTSR